MAAVSAIIANPTSAVVTVNAKTAAARTLTKVTLDDTVLADWPGWIAAGCAMGGYTGANNTQNRRRASGFMLGRLQGILP